MEGAGSQKKKKKLSGWTVLVFAMLKWGTVNLWGFFFLGLCVRCGWVVLSEGLMLKSEQEAALFTRSCVSLIAHCHQQSGAVCKRGWAHFTPLPCRATQRSGDAIMLELSWEVGVWVERGWKISLVLITIREPRTTFGNVSETVLCNVNRGLITFPAQGFGTASRLASRGLSRGHGKIWPSKSSSSDNNHV